MPAGLSRGSIRDPAAAFAAEGYLRLPDFLDHAAVERYRAICDRVLALWTAEQGGRARLAGVTNMAYLTERRYFEGRPDELTALLELIAAPRVLKLLATVSGQKPLFHNTQYFPQPVGRSWQGLWHRDTQFLAPEPDLEKQRMAQSTGVHFRIAFADDPNLMIVPGSHRRYDTPAERAIRHAADERVRRRGAMPGAVALPLARGDALLFHAWSIHRGTYDAGRDRATFDVIHGWGAPVDYFPPPPMCFADPAVLTPLTAPARAYFRRFIDTYEPYWRGTRQAVGNG